jgi:hypothetical protein
VVTKEKKRKEKKKKNVFALSQQRLSFSPKNKSKLM